MGVGTPRQPDTRRYDNKPEAMEDRPKALVGSTQRNLDTDCSTQAEKHILEGPVRRVLIALEYLDGIRSGDWELGRYL